MPELPEVEVIKQSLDKKIKFKKINKVLVRNRNLRFPIPKNFEFFLKNKKINEISRKSKYLIFHLNNNTFLIIHLGMTGTIHLNGKKNCRNAIKKANKLMGLKGRILVRKSGTEPKIRIMAESYDKSLVLKCIKIIKSSIQ